MIVVPTVATVTAGTTATVPVSTLPTAATTRGRRKNESTEIQKVIDEH